MNPMQANNSGPPTYHAVPPPLMIPPPPPLQQPARPTNRPNNPPLQPQAVLNSINHRLQKEAIESVQYKVKSQVYTTLVNNRAHTDQLAKHITAAIDETTADMELQTNDYMYLLQKMYHINSTRCGPSDQKQLQLVIGTTAPKEFREHVTTLFHALEQKIETAVAKHGKLFWVVVSDVIIPECLHMARNPYAN